MSERIKNALMGLFAPHYERARTGSPVVNALAPRQGLERMDLLPLVREHAFNGEDVEAGPWQLGLPQVGADVFNVMMAMRGAPIAGPVPDRATTDQMIGHAGAVVGPMVAGGYVVPKPRNVLGSSGGRNAKGPRPEPGAGNPETVATGASRVLAETDLSLFSDAWHGKHPYQRAEEVAAALRQAFPDKGQFEVIRSGSAAGDSAYVRTRWGDIRISDHFAYPKPGVAWSDFGRNAEAMSPRKFVEFAMEAQRKSAEKANKIDVENIALLSGPRPKWMSQRDWYDLRKRYRDRLP